jgi:hypothetical protein
MQSMISRRWNNQKIPICGSRDSLEEVTLSSFLPLLIGNNQLGIPKYGRA